MIGVLEKTPETFSQPSVLPPDGMMNLYAGLFRTIAAQNSTANVHFVNDENYVGQLTDVTTSGSYPPLSLWTLPVAPTTQNDQLQKISLRRAKEMAINALLSAEKRRQIERDEEAKYWADLVLD